MIELKFISDEPLTPRLLYVLEFLNDHPINKNKLKLILNTNSTTNATIYYGSEQGKIADYKVKSQQLIFSNKPTGSLDKLYANKYSHDDKLLYSVENHSSDEHSFIIDGFIGFDIFEMIFFHISRLEETVLKQSKYLDNKLKFEKQLFSIKNGIEKIAVVDDLVLILYEIITNQKLRKSTHKSLSHDIDHIQLFKNKLDIVKKTAGIIYRRKGLHAMKVLYTKYRDYLNSSEDPFNTFKWMMDSQADKKQIYFLVGGTHQWDSVYDLNHKNFNTALSQAINQGYEIGVHPSYESWKNQELVINEKRRLEETIQKEISISRQHFLNFDILLTPAILVNSGIAKDSSLGYTRHIGYRCGTAYTYRLYDFNNEQTSKLLEEPLVFMDMAWYYEAQRTDNWKLELDLFHGCFNFHNSFFFQAEQSGIDMKEAYLSTFGS